MGTGSYSDTPYFDSSYSDNSYSAAKVFVQVMFVTVTVPLGVTLYASCVGHFSMFTSAHPICLLLGVTSVPGPPLPGPPVPESAEY